MNDPILLIAAAFLGSLICAVIPRRFRPFFALAVSLFTLAVSFNIFRIKAASWCLFGAERAFRVDGLSAFTLLASAFFGPIVILYSAGFLEGRRNAPSYGMYYPYILAAIAASAGIVLSNNLLLFIGFWEFLGLLLYLLIAIGGENAKAAAKKTFIMVGGADALILLGAALIWKTTGTLNMDEIAMPLDSGMAIFSFVLLAIGAFAKAGAVPLHTWIPDSSETAPLPVMAFLPAGIDKLTGIYFLARMTLSMFVVQPNSAISVFLLAIGALTIIAAVMMALVQHNMKRLLSYHAVSQVGYMVLGIGTASPLGIAGGLFHMLNNAVYKCALFLTAGAVEKEAGSTDLDSLGGLARFMPVTFTCCLIASLAISGVPPFNGFASKWMIYQGIIELGAAHNKTWVLWLTAAMFGSALTLASFMKLLHAVFLGQGPFRGETAPKEAPAAMRAPMVILSFLCVVFGVFAFRLPVREFIIPAVSGTGRVLCTGLWQPAAAAALLLAGLSLGVMIYAAAGNLKNNRVVETFTGGETLPSRERPTGTEFYNTISDIPFFCRLYRMAGDKMFDIYEVLKKTVFSLAGLLQRLHNGVLPTYLAWCLIGMMAVFIFLMRPAQ